MSIKPIGIFRSVSENLEDLLSLNLNQLEVMWKTRAKYNNNDNNNNKKKN